MVRKNLKNIKSEDKLFVLLISPSCGNHPTYLPPQLPASIAPPEAKPQKFKLDEDFFWLFWFAKFKSKFLKKNVLIEIKNKFCEANLKFQQKSFIKTIKKVSKFLKK